MSSTLVLPAAQKAPMGARVSLQLQSDSPTPASRFVRTIAIKPDFSVASGSAAALRPDDDGRDLTQDRGGYVAPRQVDLASAFAAAENVALRGISGCGAEPRELATPASSEEANTVTPPPTVGRDDLPRDDRRRERWTLRRAARGIYSDPGAVDLLDSMGRLPRYARCGHTAAGGAVGVHASGSGRDRAAWFSGLVTCGSVWACPVCSAKVLAKYTEEGMKAHTYATSQGARAFMLTATIKHEESDRLDELLPGLLDAWQRMQNGVPWRRWKRRAGVLGTMRRVEMTRGRNGWHPHIHVVIWAKKDVIEDWPWLLARWRSMVARSSLGKARIPDHALGLHLKECDENTGPRYAAKAILEVTASDTKTGAGWTVAKLYRRASDLQDHGGERHSPRARRAWLEYVRATKGHRVIGFSADIRKAAKLGEEETEEAMAADAPEDGAMVARIPISMWWQLRRFPRAAVGVLEAVEALRWSDVVAAGAILEKTGPPDSG